jgi:uncharacterized protein
VSTVIILGASARAAAFSALRAGLQPWCVDLFADADLQHRCPVQRLTGRYPQGFLEAMDRAPHAPWFYTGGLENWPNLVGRLSERRPLWGNPPQVLRQVRRPETIYRLLREASLPAPRVRSSPPTDDRVRWLIKPRRSAGGSGIRPHDAAAATVPNTRGVYFQQYIEGDPLAAVYRAVDGSARLLGVTQQLVGEPWLHAAPFHYCGSLGPVECNPLLRENLNQLGSILTESCHLQGLFGVDGVLRDRQFWPVEVNPRYTASVEVLEVALGMAALGQQSPTASAGPSSGMTLGKAILFARQPIIFPTIGPWLETLAHPTPLDELPAFADLPFPNTRIEAGRPILTFFASADSPLKCLGRLRVLAAQLDRIFYQ